MICFPCKSGMFTIIANTSKHVTNEFVCNIFLPYFLTIEISTFTFNTLLICNWAKLFICYKFTLTSNEKNFDNFAHNCLGANVYWNHWFKFIEFSQICYQGKSLTLMYNFAYYFLSFQRGFVYSNCKSGGKHTTKHLNYTRILTQILFLLTAVGTIFIPA